MIELMGGPHSCFTSDPLYSIANTFRQMCQEDKPISVKMDRSSWEMVHSAMTQHCCKMCHPDIIYQGVPIYIDDTVERNVYFVYGQNSIIKVKYD